MHAFATLLLIAGPSLGQDADGEAIAHHIDAIFRAYIEKDRETVVATHTQDWLGYQSRSLHLVRGLDAYMVNASFALEGGRGSGHEMLQIVPRVYGNIAVAPYVARYVIGEGDEAFSILYRAIDIYRRDEGGWNQCGTNICVMSDDPPAYPTEADFERYPRLRPDPLEDPPVAPQATRDLWAARRASAEDEALLRAGTLRSLTHLGDAAALGRLRTDDWVGFDLTSTEVLIRNGPVVPAGDAWSRRLADAEILELETQLYGEHAVVYALVRAIDAEGGTFLIRLADVWRRTPEGWRQRASHPNPIPDVLRE